MAVSDWSTSPVSNSTQPGINWAEGMAPAAINDSARQMMADIAAWRANMSVGTLTASGVITAAGLASSNGVTSVYNAAGPEGGQLVLGYPGVTAVSEVNGTWNVDVDSTSTFRIFSHSGAGAIGVRMTINPDTGLVSFPNSVGVANTLTTNFVTAGGVTANQVQVNGNVGATGVINAAGMRRNGQDLYGPDNTDFSGFARLSGAAFTGGVSVAGGIGTPNISLSSTSTSALNLSSGGNIRLTDSGGSTSKYLRNNANQFDIVNSAYSAALFSVSDAALVTVYNDIVRNGSGRHFFDLNARQRAAISDGTAAPSGGFDGDIYFQYS